MFTGLKRHRIRIGLSNLLLAVAILALVFAMAGPQIRKLSVARRWQSVGARMQGYDAGKALGLVLEKQHRMKAEDWENIEMDEIGHIGFRGKVKPEEWELLAGMSGPLLLDLRKAEIDDSELPVLLRLPITQLILNKTQITDAGLVYISGLPIEVLKLEGTAVSDASISYLAQMKNLKDLRLAGTKITDAGVAALRKKLPNCTVRK